MTTHGHGRTGRFTRTTTIAAAAVAFIAGGPATAPAHAEQLADAHPSATSARGLTEGDPVTISSGTVPTTDAPGLLRGPDGVLNVSYVREHGDAGYVVAAVARVGADGRVLSDQQVVGPLLSIEGTTLSTTPSGMRMAFSSSGLGGSYQEQGGIYHALRDANGAWTLPAEGLNKSEGPNMDSVTLTDGTPVTAVDSWSGFWLRAGTFTGREVDAPDDQAMEGTGGYNINLERVGDEVYVAWNTLGRTSGPGTFVQRVHPTRGPVVPAPGSAWSADAVGSINPSALAVSTTGQLYSAYCTGTAVFECRHINLWNVTTGHVERVRGSADAKSITLTSAPNGRMWITWRSDSSVLTGVRTNRSGTAVGAPTVRRMDGDHSFPHSAAESSLGFADVVLTSSGRHHLARLLPSLHVDTSARRLRAGRAQRITFEVTDAGDPVRGAKVRAAGTACRTSSSGRCTLRVRPVRAQRLAVKVTARSYAQASTALEVRR